MDLIRDALDWIATNFGELLANLWPYMMLGLLGLYLLWLVIGYLRVSQVGIADRPPAPAVALPGPSDTGDRPRGVPYCPVDNLQFPAGARFCTTCCSTAPTAARPSRAATSRATGAEPERAPPTSHSSADLLTAVGAHDRSDR